MKSQSRIESRSLAAMAAIHARNLGTTLDAETSLERPVAFGFVHPDEPDEVTVGRNVASVDNFPAAVLLMVRYFSSFGSGPPGVIECVRACLRVLGSLVTDVTV
eukprot:5320200-Pleurochrysis_carterae.AAC.1